MAQSDIFRVDNCVIKYPL